MTVREKIEKYLAKQTKPKLLDQIVKGAKVNANSARRELANMRLTHVACIGYAMYANDIKRRAV